MQTFLVEKWFGVTIGTVSTIENQLASGLKRISRAIGSQRLVAGITRILSIDHCGHSSE
jgi:hypothetical protein